MKKWTTQAEKRLEDYLRERVAREGLEGEDAVELKDDLRRHIHEEVEKSESESCGLMQLEWVLSRLEIGVERPPVLPPAKPKNRGWFASFLVWTFGVVMPALVLVFEVISAFCGSVFFDPVPTWWHVACVAAVPVVNLSLLRGWFGLRKRAEGAAAGFVLMITLFYALLFLPLFHLSVIALLYVGLGLVSLTPVFAVFASWRIGVAGRRNSADTGRYKAGWRMGVLAGVLVLAVLELPGLWTRVNLNQTMGEGQEEAIGRLRFWHSERVLLKACYEGNRGTQMGTDIAGWLAGRCLMPLTFDWGGGEGVPDSERARDVFFRVTGKSFNSLKPPGSARGGRLLGRGDPMAEFEFDDHLGGDDVAVRLRDLDLAQSRMDGHVDVASGLGYGEWTMVFRNRSSEVKEARCQVRLPRGGHVSRLTLWVNGEPREAAFSTISKVKAAYRAIAVVQRRDPVLVNVCGPDTVMVQCFPVPAQGEMKIRLGITAPVVGGRWEMPYVLERNFGLDRSLEHAVWMQADESFEIVGESRAAPSSQDGPGHSLSVSLDGESVLEGGKAVRMAKEPKDEIVWCEDRFAKPEERILIREKRTVEVVTVARPIVVVDGSAAMKEVKSWIHEALAKVPDVEMILADDSARSVTLAQLKEYRYSGGRDNEPALREAIRRARGDSRPIVWIHGPQAVSLSQTEALLQGVERGSRKLNIIDVEAVAGPNRLAEALGKTGCLVRGPALLNPVEDFSRLLEKPSVDDPRGAWQWRRAASSEGLAGRQVWDHLARGWAAATAENKDVAMSDGERAELAARYQLVTLHSGAVVLETQQQYDEHGLTPVDGDAVPGIPNIPEPSTGLLVLIAGLMAAMRRKRCPAV